MKGQIQTVDKVPAKTGLFYIYSRFILLVDQAWIGYKEAAVSGMSDDVSKLKIFEFDHRMQTYCRLLGYKSIRQLAEGSTKGRCRNGKDENGNY